MTQRVFAELLPPSVVVREGVPKDCAALGQLYPEELKAVERAVEKRRTQYAATRHLARQAMQALGIAPAPVLNAPDRSPIWPEAAIGSITHADTWCGVALAKQEHFAGIGIDVEDAGALSEGVAERVLTQQEDQFLKRYHPTERLRLAKLFFSAKEAFYKCQYIRSQQFLGFEEVRLEFDFSRRTFRAEFLTEVPAWSDSAGSIEGRYVWARDVVATCAFCTNPG